MPTISILVTGKVQGVFYRQSTREKALSLGIRGTVENRPGGDVLVIATGDRDKLDQLVNWCRQGPPRAEVVDVSVKEIAPQEHTSFSIVR